MCRATVIRTLRKGGTLTDAAALISSYPKAIRRYANQHPKFLEAMDRARAEGERRGIIADGVEVLPAEIPDVGAQSPPEYVGPPAPHTVDAAEALGVDVDLVAAVDASLPVVPGLPRMSVLNVLAFQWSTMHDQKEPPLLRKACNDVTVTYVLGPILAAQQRRDERASRLERSESVTDIETVGDSGGASGLEIIQSQGVTLEIPSNGSEAPGQAPKPRPETVPA